MVEIAADIVPAEDGEGGEGAEGAGGAGGAGRAGARGAEAATGGATGAGEGTEKGTEGVWREKGSEMVARMSVTELELAHVDAKIVLETAEHALGPLPEDLEANPHAPQQTGMIDPLDSSANWSFYSARCGPSDEYQDRNPRRGVLLATIAYMIPVGGAVL
eukprot:2588666-Rhodomonas_salina.1